MCSFVVAVQIGGEGDFVFLGSCPEMMTHLPLTIDSIIQPLLIAATSVPVLARS